MNSVPSLHNSRTYTGNLSAEDADKISKAAYTVIGKISSSPIKEVYVAVDYTRSGNFKKFVLDIEWEAIE